MAQAPPPDHSSHPVDPLDARCRVDAGQMHRRGLRLTVVGADADSKPMHRLRRTAAVVCAVATTVGVCGCGRSAAPAPAPVASNSSAPQSPSQPAPATAAGVLTVANARAIVARLWAEREQALATLDPSRLSAFDTASARAADRGYMTMAHCGCEPRKDQHPLDRIVLEIPRKPSGGAFLAQVRTTNARDGLHAWYVIAITHADGKWRIGFVTFGWYKTPPPLARLAVADGYTAPITLGDRRDLARLAGRTIRTVAAHAARTSRMSYGATVHAQAAFRPAADGVYGLALPGGRLLACYTVHEVDTYSLRGGLLQSDAQNQWGPFLTPGAYSTITADTEATQCVVGRATGHQAGELMLQYGPQLIATTGVPL
jgi:hypothetical protein